MLQGGLKFRKGIDPLDLGRQTVRVQQVVDQLGVQGVVFEVQNSQWLCH